MDLEPSSKRLIIAFVIVIVVVASVTVAQTLGVIPGNFLDDGPDDGGETPDKGNMTPGFITDVADGDTFYVAEGGAVRMLGINTAEKGEFYSNEATLYLRTFIGKTVWLESDEEDRDGYGRMLRHVFACDNETYLNAELVRLGHAHLFLYDNTLKHRAELIEAEEYAREHQIGIWEPSPYDVEIVELNLHEERVRIKNMASTAVNLTDWTLKDESWHMHHFKDMELAAGATLTIIYASNGQDTNETVYWHIDLSYVWNDEGDSAYLRDGSGLLVDFLRVPDNYSA